MLPAEEENDNEVRRVDQDNINAFARLNATLHEVRNEIILLKKEMERLDDASTELMMLPGSSGGGAGGGVVDVMLVLGEAFMETTEEEAAEHCESAVEKTQSRIDKLESERDDILHKQDELKKILYGRFGKSINLEEK